MLFNLFKRKPKYPALERRGEPRYEAEDEFLIDIKSGNSIYIGSSRDISVHGVRFATTGKLKRKREVLLNFKFPEEFPGTRRFSAGAQVVRIYKPRGTARYRVGCRLQHYTQESEEAIRQYIQWLELRIGNQTRRQNV